MCGRVQTWIEKKLTCQHDSVVAVLFVSERITAPLNAPNGSILNIVMGNRKCRFGTTMSVIPPRTTSKLSYILLAKIPSQSPKEEL